MPRRVTLPGADELFRSTGGPVARGRDDDDATAEPAEPREPAPNKSAPHAPVARPSGPRRPSGRERHEEKITVYVSPGELVDLEHARLTLRAEYGLAVDRGRVVREALAVVLADLESKGGDSILVRRLRGR
ncbi:MAG TPA: cobyrinic acid a,c-diamide synthase [Mycobacteriales bacterium]|nr:cobyrinic acid a,c-diamide synthase [Mycobacteriales bacterium]